MCPIRDQFCLCICLYQACQIWAHDGPVLSQSGQIRNFFRYNFSTCTEMYSENVPHLSNFGPICSQGCLIWLQIGCDWLKMRQIWDFYKFQCILTRRSKINWKKIIIKSFFVFFLVHFSLTCTEFWSEKNTKFLNFLLTNWYFI